MTTRAPGTVHRGASVRVPRVRHLPRLDVVRAPWLRVLVGAAGLGLAVVAVREAPSGWPVWLMLVAPDLPGLAGAGRSLARGQMHPRAVPAYNATHRLLGGVTLLLAAGLGAGALVGCLGLAWLAHVLVDRAAGYTLRSPDGFTAR